MSGYASNKEIFMKVEVDEKSILGTIARIDALAEELVRETNHLKRMVSISEMPLSDNRTVADCNVIMRDIDAGKITVNQAREALGLPKNNDNGLSDQYLVKLEKSCNETENAQKESP